jgi:hypothetical protein
MAWIRMLGKGWSLRGIGILVGNVGLGWQEGYTFGKGYIRQNQSSISVFGRATINHDVNS